jgi:hypothetical protein
VRARRSRSPGWAELLHGGGWLLASALGVIAMVRLLSWESRSTFIALNALTPILLLPARHLAIVAGILRRWAVLAAGGLLVGLVSRSLRVVPAAVAVGLTAVLVTPAAWAASEAVTERFPERQANTTCLPAGSGIEAGSKDESGTTTPPG